MTANIGKEREPRQIFPKEEGDDREVIERAFQIKRDDVLTHGITPNCPGFVRAITGGVSQNHTPKCREIFEKRLI